MKDALMVLGMGGPDSIDAIEPFLKNLLMDREIINFGIGTTLQNFIAGRIAKSRSAKTAPMYEKMGGGSPQYQLTKSLVNKIALMYKEDTGVDLDTYIGMSYWNPFIEDSIDECMQADAKNNYRRLYLLPMYPQFSTVTSGVCFNRVNRALLGRVNGGMLCRVNSFHTFRPYLECVARRINGASEVLSADMGDTHLLFSAHSLPQRIVDNGDPYLMQLQVQMTLINNMVKPHSSTLSFQSKIGRMKWLIPSTGDELRRLAAGGIQNIVVYAISFVNDHIETLIELDDELIPLGKSLGLNIVRAETLNDSDDFAFAMMQLLTFNQNTVSS